MSNQALKAKIIATAQQLSAEQKRLGRTRREVWLTKEEAAIVMPKIRAIVAKLRKTGTSSGEPQ